MSSVRKWIVPLFGAATVVAFAQPVRGVQQIEETRCPKLRVAAAVDTLILRCARVIVPQRRRSEPDQALAPVELQVVIFTRRETPLDATPVLYLAGGPGESAIDEVAGSFLGTPVGQLLISQRAIVAFDQRGFSGAGREAKPWLGGLRRPPDDTLPLSKDQLFTVLRSVGTSLRAQGVDPRNFNSVEAAADVVDVLRTLGYQRAILFGTSYGTRVALHVMEQAQEVVAAAILDAVVPPRAVAAFDLDSANVTRRRALKRLVDDCQNDERCQALYPSIVSDWSRLARAGSFVEVESAGSGGASNGFVLGPDLLAVLGAALVFEEYRVVAPALLAELAQGRLSPRAAGGSVVPAALHLASGVATIPSYGLGYLSVVCAEAPMGLPQYGGEDVCRALGVPFGGGPFVRTVSSDVPTLLFAARYDSQSRPEWADLAAQSLRSAHVLHLPGIGHVAHDQPTTRQCVADIVASFLAQPTAPDAACVAALPAPAFLDPVIAAARISGQPASPRGARH
jgi:pimeloyl-ACP methyl ester carboxylesterase